MNLGQEKTLTEQPQYVVLLSSCQARTIEDREDGEHNGFSFEEISETVAIQDAFFLGNRNHLKEFIAHAGNSACFC